MTSDLEMYLRGQYRNPDPCQHLITEWYDFIDRSQHFYCSRCKCQARITSDDFQHTLQHSLARPTLVWSK